jgi:DNA-directed RNA polymerase II subunit RPB2
MIAPIKVHNSAYGYICPVDTPEGEPVGFLKNLALMAHVSVDAEIEPITKCLDSLDIHPLNDENAHLLIT